jgi:anionic cell wall polymer biosynthesis LytR-Cps2A-Psr (LCP) family protein
MKALSTSIQTNMSSDQMKQLLRLEIASHPSWDIMSTVLEGNSKRMLGGYLMPHTSLYYMIPDENSIDEHRQYIQNMINGQKISVN